MKHDHQRHYRRRPAHQAVDRRIPEHYGGITKECKACGKKTPLGSIHTCSPQVRPKGSMCQACEHLGDGCSHLKFSSMRVIGKDKDGTQVVKCSSFVKLNTDWPAEAEARMDIIGQNGNLALHYGAEDGNQNTQS